MKQNIILLIFLLSIWGCSTSTKDTLPDFQTICNPVDISYRFQLDEPSRREAADPTVILFKDTYYLFASKSGGYWYSDDLTNWTFVQTKEIPTEEYAPTAVAIGDTVYFLASSSHGKIYKTGEPKSGKWEVAKDNFEISLTDPAFFLDDDNRLYLYWGCSDKTPIYGIELDFKNNFTPIGEPVEMFNSKREVYGWEVPGDYNTLINNSPWIEGAWMNKHKGKYYLQYSGPGTQFKSYSDGVYVSENPLDPFELEAHNPFAYKPEGFATGAGHGSTFADKFGNYWHIGTVTISVKHMFERRLSLFPTFFDNDEMLYANTKFGDYPFIVPTKKVEKPADFFPDWMLLSYHKKVTVSSSEDEFQPQNMTDENIRTYWSAQSGSNSEWALIDLESNYDVKALQINFAEQNAALFDRQEGLNYQYIVESSKDKTTWKTIVDKSENQSDESHDYTQLPKAENCRYLRISKINVPGGKVALSGFRVFGIGKGSKPSPVQQFEISRNEENRRTAELKWAQSTAATGYNICYGIAGNKLYQTYTVYNTATLNINSLNANSSYFFTIEAFNENGVTSGTTVQEIK